MANDAEIHVGDTISAQDLSGEDCTSSAGATSLSSSVVNRSLGDSFTDAQGHVWKKLNAAAEHYGGNDRFARAIRLWITPDKNTQRSKVPGEQRGDGGRRAPWYVDMDALEQFLLAKYGISESDADARFEALQLALLEADYITPSEGMELATTKQGALPAASITSIFEEIRELNEDARREIAEQSGRIEKLLTEQLEAEREEKKQLTAELLAARIELAKKEAAEVIDLTDSPVEETPEKKGFLARLFS